MGAKLQYWRMCWMNKTSKECLISPTEQNSFLYFSIPTLIHLHIRTLNIHTLKIKKKASFYFFFDFISVLSYRFLSNFIFVFCTSTPSFNFSFLAILLSIKCVKFTLSLRYVESSSTLIA